jgi:hypothetical protein
MRSTSAANSPRMLSSAFTMRGVNTLSIFMVSRFASFELSPSPMFEAECCKDALYS